MVGFSYYNPAKIIFGTDAQTKLKDLLDDLGVTSLLMVYSGEFVKELGIYQTVETACSELGIVFYENGDVVPNPSIDTAKSIALGIPYPGDVWDFFAKGVTPERVLPIGVITTIPASGSETSNAAILSNQKWKLGFEDDRIIPKFAIMNPRYTLGLPKFQTAAGVADILSHLLERYFSDVEHTDVTDALIEGAVRALLKNGRQVVAHPEDLDARSEIQWLIWRR